MRLNYSNASNEQWQQMFEQRLAELTDFQNRFNRFPTHKDDAVLNRWLTAMVADYKAKRLAKVYIDKLNAIGMLWNANDIYWYEKYKEAKQLLTGSGHIPAKADNESLHNWITNQLKLLRLEKISGRQKELIADLQSLLLTGTQPETENIDIDKKEREEKKWAQLYDELAAFLQKNHRWPIVNKGGRESALGSWCAKQRRRYRGASLSDTECSKLKEIGFSFNPKEEIWMFPFEQVKHFAQAHKSLLGLPGNLRTWCHVQHRSFASLNLQRQQLLHSIQFADLYSSIGLPKSWEEWFAELEAYTARYAKLPAGKKEGLCGWLLRQKEKNRLNRLPDYKKQKLAAAGVILNARNEPDGKWLSNYEALKTFREQNGGIWPRYNSSGQEKKLRNWCQLQKQRYAKTVVRKSGYLQQCIDKLNAIGFPWSDGCKYFEDKWENNFQLLKQFNAEHGKERLYKKLLQINRKDLYEWLLRQKKAAKDNQLAAGRLNKLKTINLL